MTHDENGEDLRLTRLLRAVRADADPTLWTRVRARIESRPPVPVLLAWAMRPAALATSLALLLAASGLALVLASGGTMAGAEVATPAPAAPARPAGGAVRDSGRRL